MYLVSKNILQKTRNDPIMTYEEFKEKVGSVILTDEGNCPVTPVVQMLQGKWKLQILYELCIKCPMRFGELKKVLKPITNTALTNALKELEADELVQRISLRSRTTRPPFLKPFAICITLLTLLSVCSFP